MKKKIIFLLIISIISIGIFTIVNAENSTIDPEEPWYHYDYSDYADKGAKYWGYALKDIFAQTGSTISYEQVGMLMMIQENWDEIRTKLIDDGYSDDAIGNTELGMASYDKEILGQKVADIADEYNKRMQDYYDKYGGKAGYAGYSETIDSRAKTDPDKLGSQTATTGSWQSGEGAAANSYTKTASSTTKAKKDVTEQSIDDIKKAGDDFLNASDGEEKFSQDDIKIISDNIYNVLLAVAIILSVLIGLWLGIKLISNGAVGKAEVKEALVPYVLGNAIAFGAFVIWKLVVLILRAM